MKRVMVVDTSMRCPICGAPTFIRSSRAATSLLREEYLDCTNDTCPGRFKAHREIVASLFEGSYEHGLRIPECLRKQALAPAAQRPDPNQLQLPGLDPLPDLSCYGGAPPPKPAPGAKS